MSVHPFEVRVGKGPVNALPIASFPSYRAARAVAVHRVRTKGYTEDRDVTYAAIHRDDKLLFAVARADGLNFRVLEEHEP